MTQLEINKKIAELKGMKCLPLPYSKNSIRVFLENESCHLGRDINWAEDIQDAWELFEEIRLAQHVSIVLQATNFSDFKNYGLKIDNGDRKFRDTEYPLAHTAPEAICLAWIKWKER